MKNQTNKKPSPKKSSSGPSSLLIWASIILFIIASFAFLPDESANEVEISYNTYKELLSEDLPITIAFPLCNLIFTLPFTDN